MTTQGESMKIENLSKKAFIDPVTKTRLLPGAGVQDFPDGSCPKYFEALAKAGKVKIVEAAKSDDPEVDESEQDGTLAEMYESLTGKKPDGRWSDERIEQEIEKL